MGVARNAILCKMIFCLGVGQTSTDLAEIFSVHFWHTKDYLIKKARQSEKSLKNTDDTAHQINDLNEASHNIGTVIKLIEQITEQTKLLALNATIEAARAGDAGKGFSVVANEVKELASQTAKATEGISTRIKEIQKQTGGVVRMIQEISINSQELNEINTSIAVTVEQQSVTTSDIAQTIAGTARGAEKVSEKEEVTFIGSKGQLRMPFFGAPKLYLEQSGLPMETFEFEMPQHIQQLLIQTVVDDLLGNGVCPSTGETAIRTNWVMEEMTKNYYSK